MIWSYGRRVGYQSLPTSIWTCAQAYNQQLCRWLVSCVYMVFLWIKRLTFWSIGNNRSIIIWRLLSGVSLVIIREVWNQLSKGRASYGPSMAPLSSSTWIYSSINLYSWGDRWCVSGLFTRRALSAYCNGKPCLIADKMNASSSWPVAILSHSWWISVDGKTRPCPCPC